MKKTLLLTLMIAAVGVLNADEPKSTYVPQPARMGDVEMKALLIGTWKSYDGRTRTFTADGKWIDDGNDPRSEDWDVTDGHLSEIRDPAVPRSFTIVFLNEHECLIWVGHDEQRYVFWWR